MPMSNIPRRRPSLLKGSLSAAGLLAAALFWSQAGVAQTAGPFAKFDGGWRGAGYVFGSNGSRERIACRAHYSIPPSGAAVSQSLICASDSYRFEVQSDVVLLDGHSVKGTWEESTRHAAGDLIGEASDGRFDGTVAGTGFTAEISIRMSGEKQAVTITPHGSDITKVDIVLARGA